MSDSRVPSPLLFVYGTLLPGQRAHSQIAPYAENWRSATTDGLLFALPGGYPGLLATRGHTVQGQLCRLRAPAAALLSLDEFEGDEYVRVMRPVRTETERVHAWCYVLADSATTRDCPRIERGDWLGYTTR